MPALDLGRLGRLAVFDVLHHLSEHPANVALAWLLHQPGLTAPIAGPRTAAQLDASLRALEIDLGSPSSSAWTIFPGPGGPAPEAYAW